MNSVIRSIQVTTSDRVHDRERTGFGPRTPKQLVGQESFARTNNSGQGKTVLIRQAGVYRCGRLQRACHSRHNNEHGALRGLR